MTTLLSIFFSALGGGFGLSSGKRLLDHGKSYLLLGLLMGFGAAAATGNQNVLRFSWMIAAFGVAGTFCGGNAEFGESSSRKILPFAVKGFLIFSVAAGFISVGIMTLGMVAYTLADILLLFFLFLLSRVLGVWLFNKGANRIRFSQNKGESWGANLLMLASIVCVSAVKADFFTLITVLSAGLFGALGQITAVFLFPQKKSFARDLTGGAIGGMGVCAGIVAAKYICPNLLSGDWFVSKGTFSGFIPQSASLIAGLIWCALWIAMTLCTRFSPKKPKLKALEPWLSDVVFCALPFLLLCLGSYHVACFSALPLALYVLVEAVTAKKSAKICLGLFWLCVLCAVAVFTTLVPAFVSFILTASAFLFAFIFTTLKKRRAGGKPASLSGIIALSVLWLLLVILWFLIF